MSDGVYLRRGGPMLFLPDVRIELLPSRAERWALCGYGHISAVRDPDTKSWLGYWVSNEPVSVLVAQGDVLVATPENCPLNPS